MVGSSFHRGIGGAYNHASTLPNVWTLTFVGFEVCRKLKDHIEPAFDRVPDEENKTTHPPPRVLLRNIFEAGFGGISYLLPQALSLPCAEAADGQRFHAQKNRKP